MDNLQKTGNAIYNDDIRRFIAERIENHFSSSNLFNEMVDIPGYIKEFRHWVQSTQTNKVYGLESFTEASVSLGVTQAIDEFHYQILLEGRRLRLFRGEYPYHRDVHPFSYEEDFIDDYNLASGDAVALSFPFSASGGKHPKMDWLLDTCQKKRIPLFLDLAWFGTCGDLEFDLRHPAITHASFSLSKGLTCGNYRSGVRFSRAAQQGPRTTDRLALQQQWSHSIHLNLAIGRQLMKHFSPDTQYNKYRKTQLQISKELGLKPSACVHISIGEGPHWDSYTRDGFCNRVNIRERVKQVLKKNGS